jgi:transposase
MVNKKQHKQGYTQEFRETAIKLALAGEKSIAEVARELSLPEWKLYSWVQAWKKKDGKRQQPGQTIEEKLKQSEKLNKELALENEILKKAAAYFAKTLL